MLRAIMDISARAISLPERPQGAIWSDFAKGLLPARIRLSVSKT